MDPLLASITLFAGNFAPRGWFFCDGQMLSIAQYSALFSLLGTTYGGDGITTFALPDLRGCVPMHPGQGPGLTLRTLGERVGTETETLNATQIPAHSHQVVAANVSAASDRPGNALPARATVYATPGEPGQLTPMAADMIQPAGGSQPHDNIQPSLCLNYIIAWEGVYPSRP